MEFPDKTYFREITLEVFINFPIHSHRITDLEFRMPVLFMNQESTKELAMVTVSLWAKASIHIGSLTVAVIDDS